MFCDKCGLEIPDDSVFCPGCGNKQAKKTEKTSRKNAKAFLTGGIVFIALAVMVVVAISDGKINVRSESKESFSDSPTSVTSDISTPEPQTQKDEGDVVNEQIEETPVVELTLGTKKYKSDVETLSLKNLKLSNEDVKDLAYFTKLKEIDLSTNRVTDLSVLKNATQLEVVNITGCAISDLSFLQDMKNLRVLYGVVCQISDISVLADKAELEEINLSVNQITDISPLRDCTRLRYVSLGGNELTNPEVLSGMTQLEELWLDTCGLEEVSFLRDNHSLKILALEDNPISDLSPLKGHTMEELHLEMTLISENLQSLEGINVTKKLDVSGCNLTEQDLQMIRNLVQGNYELVCAY